MRGREREREEERERGRERERERKREEERERERERERGEEWVRKRLFEGFYKRCYKSRSFCMNSTACRQTHGGTVEFPLLWYSYVSYFVEIGIYLITVPFLLLAVRSVVHASVLHFNFRWVSTRML